MNVSKKSVFFMLPTLVFAVSVSMCSLKASNRFDHVKEYMQKTYMPENIKADYPRSHDYFLNDLGKSHLFKDFGQALRSMNQDESAEAQEVFVSVLADLQAYLRRNQEDLKSNMQAAKIFFLVCSVLNSGAVCCACVPNVSEMACSLLFMPMWGAAYLGTDFLVRQLVKSRFEVLEKRIDAWQQFCYLQALAKKFGLTNGYITID